MPQNRTLAGDVMYFVRTVCVMALLLFSAGAQAKTPGRIVSLAPSVTEIAFAAGAGDLLVAVSAFSDFPAAANQLPQIADANGVKWERLIALKPDLVLVWESGTRPQDIRRLGELKIPTLTLSIRKLGDLPEAIEAVGHATGRMQSAKAEADRLRKAINNPAPGNRGAPIRVFIEISALPLMTVNRDHVLSEIVTRCGGENVFADAPSLVVEPSREALITRKSEALLRPRTSQPAWPTYLPQRLSPAPRILSFTPDWAFRPGPRLIDAMREICVALEDAGGARSR